MRPSVFLIGAALWIVAGAGIFWFERQPVASAEQPVGTLPVIEMRIPEGWEPPRVTGFELVDQAGNKVTPETLAGKPYVAGFIFTRCATHCPDLLGKMVELKQTLGDFDGRLLTVTVDPEYDTPERMAKYGDIYSEDADEWKFVTGEPEQLLELVKYGHRNLPPGEPNIETDLGPQAAHSLRLMHVGADGQLKGSYYYRDPKDITRLARVLRGKAETAEENRIRPPVNEMIPVSVDPETGEETILKPVQPGEDIKIDEPREPADVSAVDPAGKMMFVTADASQVAVADGPIALAEQAGDQDTDEVAGEAALADPLAGLPSWASKLPLVNASLNALATVLLVAGFVFIKTKNAHAHRAVMIAAVGVSAAFLASYLVYHWALGAYTESHGRPFAGTGTAAKVYYTILITHVLLAIAVPFLVASALWRAYKRQWQAHRRIARVTFPIWLYVSVTGVVIYGMLYHWPVGA